MNNWITPKEVANGIKDLPPIPINTQNIARSKRQLQYLKIGNRVYYTYQDLKIFVEANIRKAQPKGE
jgi:hypothetical protein